METMSEQSGDTRYNGWTNRETWLANLWITNDEYNYNAARYVVRNAVEEWAPITELIGYYDDPDNRKAGELTAAADDLMDWAGAFMVPELEGFASDLFNTAFGRIDWRKVAEGLLES